MARCGRDGVVIGIGGWHEDGWAGMGETYSGLEVRF
jgi:hypothetical protein